MAERPDIEEHMANRAQHRGRVYETDRREWQPLFWWDEPSADAEEYRCEVVPLKEES